MSAFFDVNLNGVRLLSNDVVVVSLIIANYDVRRILVNNGSLANLFFYGTFCKMNLNTDHVKKLDSPHC